MKYKNLDTSIEVVNGHYDLVLKVGNLYDIHYGIHQGVYEYVGKIKEGDMDHPHFWGQHMFKQLSTGKITFGYFGYTSPYEFTSIVKPHKD